MAARSLFVALELPCPSVDAIVSATEATRSRAYELSATLIALLPSLVKARGRPPKPQSAPSDASLALTHKVLAYMMAHAGCVEGHDERCRYSDAFRGFILELRDAHATLDVETFAAVIEAFHDGLETTGAPPIALLLDNRPSNHVPNIDIVLGGTLRIRATPERPQNKAHVEGAFGLFSQVLPPLVFDTSLSPHDLAKRFVGLVVTVWARTTSHRPRKDRDGRCRVELYSDKPSEEQLELAHRELNELAERQERARRTLEARRQPEALALLDAHFARLSLLDPKRHIRVAIAGHPLDAIVAGIAIFDGKQRAGTLPDGVDARYLLGNVYNVAAKTEGMLVARRLLELRLEVRDILLAPLVQQRDAIRAECNVEQARDRCVDSALATASLLERTFWLDVLVSLLRALPGDHRDTTFLAAARRIHVTFAVSLRERHDAVRFLAERIVPFA